MTYRSFSFIPALNNNLLFTRMAKMDNLFSRLTGEAPVANTPIYNLLQKDKEHYELILSVPGYTQDELDISVLNSQITISGKPMPKQNSLTEEKVFPRWVHQGFTKNEFSLSFTLDHRINVKQSYLDHGQLILKFTYDIPEEQKPQKISIGMQDAANTTILEHAAK